MNHKRNETLYWMTCIWWTILFVIATKVFEAVVR